MQLRGGVGLFQGAAATVWISNIYSNTGVATRVVGCGGGFAACSGAGGIFSPDRQPATSFPGAAPGGERRLPAGRPRPARGVEGEPRVRARAAVVRHRRELEYLYTKTDTASTTST
jgi:hypothetical protein